jgi:hypothetical protein
MKDAKPAKTPMGTDGHLDLNKGGKSVDQKAYRSMIGSLLYLCASRPDIMLSVCMCARFQSDPKKIRSDNGSEFKNLQVEEYLEDEGIKHEFSAPYTPQQNGVVERKNRTLIDMARTMLGEYKTPERFWSEAVNTACHAINWLYLHRLLKKTSYELLTGNKPNVSYFCVFGSKCYILVKKGRHSKFAPKAVGGFLLGYDSNTKAYKVFNKSSGLVEVSSNIVLIKLIALQESKLILMM